VPHIPVPIDTQHIGAIPEEGFMIREYELGLVINPDLNDEQTEALFLRIGQVIEAQGGEIVRLDKWGRRRMAYEIQRHHDGYYAFLEFRLESLHVREVERFLLVQENVLRHLATYRDPRAQAERRRREQEAASRQTAQAAQAAQAAQNAQAAQAAAAQAAQAVATPVEEVEVPVDAELAVSTPVGQDMSSSANGDEPEAE
jgi:small subunit ribosomal protein S6